MKMNVFVCFDSKRLSGAYFVHCLPQPGNLAAGNHMPHSTVGCDDASQKGYVCSMTDPGYSGRGFGGFRKFQKYTI